MPKGLLQEKFQRTMKPEPPEPHEWATQESQRHAVHLEPLNVTSDRPGASSMVDLQELKTNQMPGGMFIDNQNPQVNDHKMQYVAAGETDVSNSVDAAMLKKGYQRQNMHPADEMYTNEHTEEFYGEATVDGKTGYLERNNYLDRT
jgi:hypothetical protein